MHFSAARPYLLIIYGSSHGIGEVKPDEGSSLLAVLKRSKKTFVRLVDFCPSKVMYKGVRARRRPHKIKRPKTKEEFIMTQRTNAATKLQVKVITGTNIQGKDTIVTRSISVNPELNDEDVLSIGKKLAALQSLPVQSICRQDNAGLAEVH